MKRVIIDMDDVMADASKGILDMYNSHYQTNFQKSDFQKNTLWQDEVGIKYLKVRNGLFQPGFFRNLHVLPDSQEVIEKLQEKYEVFIVSAAMEFPNSLKEKHEWLEEHFPFIHWKNLVLCGDKSIVSGDIMIDDHEKNLISFKGECLLYDAIHNQPINDYKRVNNWKEIGEMLL